MLLGNLIIRFNSFFQNFLNLYPTVDVKKDYFGSYSNEARASCTMNPNEGFNMFNFMSFVTLMAHMIMSVSNASNNNNNNNNNNVSLRTLPNLG